MNILLNRNIIKKYKIYVLLKINQICILYILFYLKSVFKINSFDFCFNNYAIITRFDFDS